MVLAAGTAYYLMSQETSGGDTWFDWDTAITTSSAASDAAVVWENGPGNWSPYTVSGRCFVPLDFKYLTGAPAQTSETGYVTGQKLGTVRNDFSGYVGMQVVVGAEPLTVTALGRMMASGNSGIHTVKFVRANDGAEVAGGATTVVMSGGAVGQFQYGRLSTPVVLAAGTAYYLMSQETSGGDTWFDWDTAITTSSAASDAAVVWENGPGNWSPYTVSGRCFVPLDFKYLTGAPAQTSETGYVTGQKLGTVRNDFSGYVGMQVVVGAEPLTVTALGRMMASGNSGIHTVKFVRANDGAEVAGGATTVVMSGGTVGQFQYGRLSTPVVLAAGTAYYLMSQETSGGDMWFDWDTAITTSSAASDVAVVWENGAGNWSPYTISGRCFVPLDFKYLTP